MSIEKANIPITEVWKRETWANWDVYTGSTNTNVMGRVANTIYPWGLSTQNHIDIATFLETGWSGTGATFGYLTTFNHWPGATVPVSPGTRTISITLPDALDLTTVPNGYITLALPNWPGVSTIDLGDSYIDFSSDDFATTVCSLQFAAATPPPLNPGNQSLKFPMTMVTGIDPTKVNAIRIRVTAVTSGTVYLMALRLVGPNWVPSNMDFDNSNLVLRSCIPLNGDPTYTPLGNQVMPPLWRSATVPGVDDPRPIDSSIAFIFNTGSATKTNSLTLYMREETSAYITQLNLEGTPQYELSGRPQPSGGVNEYSPRTMAELNTMTMGLLDGQTMLNLERVPDPQFSRWQAFNVTWGPSPTIHIYNSADANQGYKYDHATAPTFAAHSTYYVLCELEDIGARMRIYTLNDDGFIGPLIFDTLVIEDGFTFVRQEGRIGFQAFILDGDSYVQSIRPNSLVYAEYQSIRFASHTPVAAARLYASFTPDTPLWQSWAPKPDAMTNIPLLAQDHGRTLSGASTRVTINTPSSSLPVQSIVSNVLSPFGDSISGITNFDQLGITFDLWFPSSALSSTLNDEPPLVIFLLNAEGGQIPLTMPALVGNQWQSIELTLPTGIYPSGLYTFNIAYYGQHPVTFWIDNMKVSQRAMTWAARPNVDDPWNSNFAPWTPFKNLINSDTEAVRFPIPGSNLQIRARALQQNSAIFNPLRLVPQYAQLGRLVFPGSSASSTPTPPTAAITTTVVSDIGHDAVVTFSGYDSTPGAYPIVSYQWSFGDGTYATGPTTGHEFKPAGYALTSFTVTLTVVDSFGNADTTTSEIDV